MKRLLWFGIGVAVTVTVVVKGRQLLARATPGGALDQAARTADKVLHRARAFWTDWAEDRREIERALRSEAGLD